MQAITLTQPLPSCIGYVQLTVPLTDTYVQALRLARCSAGAYVYAPSISLATGLSEAEAPPWERVIVQGAVCLSDWLVQAELLRAKGWRLEDATLCLAPEQVRTLCLAPDA